MSPRYWLDHLVNYWPDVAVALVSMVGSIALTFMTSWSNSSKNDFESRYRGVDIQYGHFEGNKVDDPEWKLGAEGSIEEPTANFRKYMVRLTFQPPFTAPPMVIPMITGLIESNDANHRLLIYVSDRDCSPNSCILVVNTWSDSKIFQISGDWIAYQPAPQANAFLGGR
jgi:hypothetical protein